ncbi:MAG: DNA polymerase/3'-5' exonuclease PolX [Deltaproteobacteria bacterium]|nr:MAG: DNA polymerase/3'-5' exonuclease PolX [Deltaproteobacteria bacterium]
MENGTYVARLEEIADLLQVTGANPFRVRAFQKAARVIDGMAEDLDTVLAEGEVTAVDGIGKSIAEDLRQIRERGSCDLLDELRASLPDGITDLLRVQGLGPKKVKALYEELGIGDLDALEARASEGRIAGLKGFGARTEEKILKEVERLRRTAGRTPLAEAWPHAERLLGLLREVSGVERAEIAGSLRRGRETVGDLDFVVASREPGPVMEAFATDGDVEEVVARGDTKTTIRLSGGLSADVRVVPPEVFGATLHHFTGSKEHNVAIRSRALKRGLRVSEWGVFRRDGEDGGDATDGELVACATEEDIFAAVGLPFIPPELREDRGEIGAAEEDRLPELVTLEDIVADLHMHTTASDGRHSVARMAEAARDRGLKRIAITDHSRSLTVANGLDARRLRAQMEEIDAYNAGDPAVRVLKGLEVDILEDGALDMDDDVLAALDWVVGSVHQWMGQDPQTMTERLLRAIGSGFLHALGHPTGRLVGRRDGFTFDVDAVFDACADAGVALEVNASPWRVDLDDRLIQRALERDRLMLTINTDAHSTAELGQMHFGVRMARRGGCPRSRVVNAQDESP